MTITNDTIRLVLCSPAILGLIIGVIELIIIYIKEYKMYRNYYNEHHKTVKKTKGNYFITL